MRVQECGPREATEAKVDVLFAPETVRRNCIILIVLAGLLRLILIAEYFEFAFNLGLLFLTNAVGAGDSAYGIRWVRCLWGWTLRLLGRRRYARHILGEPPDRATGPARSGVRGGIARLHL